MPQNTGDSRPRCFFLENDSAVTFDDSFGVWTQRSKNNNAAVTMW